MSINPREGRLTEESVSIRSTLDPTELGATLSRPKRPRNSVVLMIGGSGKTDRNETTPGSQTYSGKTELLFKQISDALVQAHYATLRYDKRGVTPNGIDAGQWQLADRTHLVQDAVDAAKTLLRLTGALTSDLVLLGHSEGTIVAVEAAHVLENVRGLMLLGAQGVAMADMLRYQLSLVHEPFALEAEVCSVLDWIATTDEKFAPCGKPVSYYRQFLAAPANAVRAAQLKLPLLVFQGKLDEQTPLSEIQAFQAAGVKDLRVSTYPGLGHGFSPPRNGQPTLGPIAAHVLADLVKGLRELEMDSDN